MKKIIGNYQQFFSLQKQRLTNIGIDISNFDISHLAYRTNTFNEYLSIRTKIEQHCKANVENVWNGRPISKLLLKSPLRLGEGFSVEVIELIPPIHQRIYKMGLEHIGIVVGNTVDEFSRIHRSALTGQQFQAVSCEPYYVTFYEDYTTVKFYERSLRSSCEKEGQVFDGFYHVENWQSAYG